MNPCPRCNNNQLASEEAINALSRHVEDAYICSPCGEDEAFLDWVNHLAQEKYGIDHYTLEEWPIDRDLLSFDDLDRIMTGNTA